MVFKYVSFRILCVWPSVPDTSFVVLIPGVTSLINDVNGFTPTTYEQILFHISPKSLMYVLRSLEFLAYPLSYPHAYIVTSELFLPTNDNVAHNFYNWPCKN